MTLCGHCNQDNGNVIHCPACGNLICKGCYVERAKMHRPLADGLALAIEFEGLIVK